MECCFSCKKYEFKNQVEHYQEQEVLGTYLPADAATRRNHMELGRSFEMATRTNSYNLLLKIFLYSFIINNFKQVCKKYRLFQTGICSCEEIIRYQIYTKKMSKSAVGRKKYAIFSNQCCGQENIECLLSNVL